MDDITLEKAIKDDITARVRRGAEFLDQRLPEWRGKIKIEELQISSPESCILGQLYGDCIFGRGHLDLTWFDAASLGFTIYDVDVDYITEYERTIQEEYDALLKAWKEILA